MSKAQIYNEIMREYQIQKDESENLLEARKKEVYKKIPEIAKIDNALSKMGLRIIKSSFSSGNKKAVMEEIKRESKELKKRKETLLLENGYKKDYLKKVYKCNLCEDTGYINERERCKCFKQKLLNKICDISNIKDIIKEENFDNFNLEYFSTEVNENEGISPQKNIKNIFNTSVKFINNFDKQFSNMLFYGPSGLGKTYLCNCIAKELLEEGKTVLYFSAFNLFKILENNKFSRENTVESEIAISMLEDADLLIIDDLGTESPSSVTEAELFNIINRRLLLKKSIIISTNLDLEKLSERYSYRVFSRIYGNYKTLEFFGDDIRILKKTSGIMK